MKKIKRTGRFTLIELLIVVAIISITAAMLLPALNKSRMTARKAHCINNLKQIGIIFESYAVDSQDWFPTYYNGNSEWFKVLCDNHYVSYSYMQARGDRTVGGSKAGRKTIFWCPEDKRDPISINTAAGISYGINSIITCNNGTIAYKYLRRNQIARKTGWSVSQNSLIMDSWSGVNYSTAGPYSVAAYVPENLDFRHNTTINVLYCDGHVENGKRSVIYYKVATDNYWGKYW